MEVSIKEPMLWRLDEQTFIWRLSNKGVLALADCPNWMEGNIYFFLFSLAMCG